MLGLCSAGTYPGTQTLSRCPTYRVKRLQSHPQKADTHTRIVTVSIIANWLFVQWRERLVSTKGSCLGWSVVSSDARLEFHVVWRLSVPQSCLTIEMFVQWQDEHEAAVGTRQAEGLSNKVKCYNQHCHNHFSYLLNGLIIAACSQCIRQLKPC